jgi:hypothetical protein
MTAPRVILPPWRRHRRRLADLTPEEVADLRTKVLATVAGMRNGSVA